MSEQHLSGVYSPNFEHDACGIGAVVSIRGIKTYQTVDDALKIVEKLEHRAGKDAAGETGDVTGLVPTELAPSATAVEGAHKLTKVTILCNEERFGILRDTMAAIGVTGMTVTNVMGCGEQLGKTGQYRGVEMSMNLFPKIQVDIVVSKVSPGLVVAAAQKALYTGKTGDGKIFVYNVDNVVKVRTGEKDYDALQDQRS